MVPSGSRVDMSCQPIFVSDRYDLGPDRCWSSTKLPLVTRSIRHTRDKPDSGTKLGSVNQWHCHDSGIPEGHCHLGESCSKFQNDRHGLQVTGGGRDEETLKHPVFKSWDFDVPISFVPCTT